MELHPSIWPSEYVCPISRCVMADPVIVSSGHTYERRCIETWLGLGQTVCVKQNTHLIPDYIIPNIALRDAIANFAISKGMHALPSPPSPGVARALAKQAIMELQALGHLMQPSDLAKSDARHMSMRVGLEAMINQTEREVSIVDPDQGQVQNFRAGELEGESYTAHRLSTIGMGAKQKRGSQQGLTNSHTTSCRQRTMASRGHQDITGHRHHRQPNNVQEGVVASGEQRRQAYGGYNDEYDTVDMSVLHRQLEIFDRLRVSRKQGGCARDTYRESHGNMDPTHRDPDSGGQHKVSRDGSYITCFTGAQEGKEAARGHVDDTRGFTAIREQRQGFSECYNRDSLEITESLRMLCDGIKGLQVSNEEKGAGCCIASDKEATDISVSDDFHDLTDSRVRGSLHDDHNGCHETEDSLDAYAKYRRVDGYISPTRYFHSAPEEDLLRTDHGQGELPPNLVTRPFSYSTEAPTPVVASLPPSSTTSSFIEKLRDPYPEVHTAAIMKLRELTRMYAEIRLSLCSTSLIHALLPHLNSESSVVQVNGVAALLNLSIEKQNKVMIVRLGAVPYLVEVLKHGVPEAQEHAAGAIFTLALADENKAPIGVLNTIPPLCHLLLAGSPGARQDAAMALYQLSLCHMNRSKLVKVGAIPILLHVAEFEERLDLVGRVLLIVSNVAANPEGRTMLLEQNAITTLVNLLAVRSDEHVPEQAAATLLLLSKGSRQFKKMASFVGAQKLLTVLADVGTARARKKAIALLAIMKEGSSVGRDDMLSKQYLRRNKGRVDGTLMNSSAF